MNLSKITIKNPKSEYRNPKQIQISNDPNTKRFWNIQICDFEFVSRFEFRASNLCVKIQQIHET